MKLLNKARGSGKTAGLIYASESTGYPIVVAGNTRACYIKDQAREMCCNIPDPITVNDIRLHHVVKHDQNILFDDVDTILECALKEYLNGANVVCATITLPMQEKYEPVESDENKSVGEDN